MLNKLPFFSGKHTGGRVLETNLFFRKLKTTPLTEIPFPGFVRQFFAVVAVSQLGDLLLVPHRKFAHDTGAADFFIRSIQDTCRDFILKKSRTLFMLPSDTPENTAIQEPMDEVYTTKELAAKAGVPWQTIAAWKRNNRIPLEAVTPDGRFLKAVVDPILESGGFQEPPAAPYPQKSVAHSAKKGAVDHSFEDFARTYWQEGTKAVDVLLMPEETGTLLVRHVNDALRYAWKTLR